MSATAPSPAAALLLVPDMHCGACVGRIRQALEPFAVECEPAIAARTLSLRPRANAPGLDRAAVVDALRSAGFAAHWPDEDPGTLARRRAEISRIALSALLSMQVMMLALPGYLGVVAADTEHLLGLAQWVLATPVVWWAGAPFFQGARQALARRQVSMDLPVALALAIAYGASVAALWGVGSTLYFDSAVMFVSLLSLGRWAETRGRARASSHLSRLIARQPRSARVERAGGIQELPLTALQAGDIVHLRPGDTLPADGRLLDPALLSEGVLTGEAAPVSRAAGERAHAGSHHVGSHVLRLEVDAVGDGALIGRITALAQEALTQKHATQRRHDRLASAFILGVLVAAVTALLAWWPAGPAQALHITLAVLVASCPCALSLAGPAATAASIGRLARHGVLVARSEGLLAAASTDTVLLDKTGTLTSSGLQLQRQHTAPGEDAVHCVQIAAGLEAGSRHPIAQAFRGHASLVAQSLHQAADGVSGEVAGHRYRLGRLDPEAANTFDIDRDDGLTWLGLTRAGLPHTLAAFGLGATPRPGLGPLLSGLAPRSLELLSGDATGPTQALARQLGLTRWRAELSPQGKAAAVRLYRQGGARVMALGDGINDAGFLAAADTGIALGEGAAQAQAVADIILLEGQLDALPQVLEESRRLRRRLAQNQVWAVGYNLSVFPLALAGVLAPWMAALGMSLSSALVVINASRQREWRGHAAERG